MTQVVRDMPVLRPCVDKVPLSSGNLTTVCSIHEGWSLTPARIILSLMSFLGHGRSPWCIINLILDFHGTNSRISHLEEFYTVHRRRNSLSLNRRRSTWECFCPSTYSCVKLVLSLSNHHKDYFKITNVYPSCCSSCTFIIIFKCRTDSS